MIRSLLLLFPVLLALLQPKSSDKDAAAGLASITVTDLKAYLTNLASDEFQGRETSYAGEKLAAAYIADHFKTIGLKPAGDDDSFLQHYDVDLVRVSDASSLLVSAGSATQTFTWANDFMAFSARDTLVAGPVAFVGYADSRTPPAMKPDLAGRVVVAFAGSQVPKRDTAGSPSSRRMLAGGRRDSGTVATLIILEDSGATSYSTLAGQLAEAGAFRGRMTLTGEPVRQRRRGPSVFYISSAVARSILAPTGFSLSDLRERASQDSSFTPILVDNVTVTLNTSLDREKRQAVNVVGILEGSDPDAKDEAVVFSAHFDHLGVGSNGAIYHGADDDGSGTATLMELAQAFATNSMRSKASLIFLAVSGEEKGLLGSQYYTTHPVISLDHTVANFNVDMIGRIDSSHEHTSTTPYTYLIGSDKISTELDSILQAANRETENIQIDYTYNDENDPNQFYRRSDHYNFARSGVPIAFFFTGVHADYHKPTDTIEKIQFDRMVMIARLVYSAGWKTANIGRMLVKNGSGRGFQDPPTPTPNP